MVSQRDRLSEVLREHLSTMSEWCKVYDIAEMILPDIGRKRITERLLDEITNVLDRLEEEGEVTVGSDGCEDSYRSPWPFRNGKHFLVRMTELEQTEKILVPGHRFLPFCNLELHPREATLLFHGEPVPKREVMLPFKNVFLYISLLGVVGETMYLQGEVGEDSLEAVAASNADVTLVAYDFRNIIKTLGKGPSYRLRSCDARRGIYELLESVQPANTLQFGPYRNAVSQLDAVFEELFEDDGPDLDTPELIEEAYRQMPPEFLENPPFHFGAYLSTSKKVALVDTPLGRVLWRKGENPALPLLDAFGGQEGFEEFMLEQADKDPEEAIAALQAMLELALQEQGPVTEDVFNQDLLFDLDEFTTPKPAARSRDRKAGSASRKKDAKQDNAVYTFKVALDGAARINRIIEVHGTNTWHELHNAIFDAFDREEEHLYSFYLTGKKTQSPRTRCTAPEIACPVDFDDGFSHGENAMHLRIGDAGIGEGFILYYLFDYGDSWWHQITLQKIEPGAKTKKGYPQVVKRTGESPPQYPEWE